MKIKVLGSGCAKCKTLATIASKSIEELGLDATVEKVTDIQDIMGYGVMMTPALVIDEKLISSGKSYSDAFKFGLIFSLNFQRAIEFQSHSKKSSLSPSPSTIL